MRNTVLIVIAALLAVGLMGLPLLLWSCKFGLGFGGTTETWSHFGTFFSGVAGPIMAALSVAGVLFTLHAQRASNKEQATANSQAETTRLETTKRELQLKAASEFCSACSDLKSVWIKEVERGGDVKDANYIESAYTLAYLHAEHVKRLYPAEMAEYPVELRSLVVTNAKIAVKIINSYVRGADKRDKNEINTKSTEAMMQLIKIHDELVKKTKPQVDNQPLSPTI